VKELKIVLFYSLAVSCKNHFFQTFETEMSIQQVVQITSNIHISCWKCPSFLPRSLVDLMRHNLDEIPCSNFVSHDSKLETFSSCSILNKGEPTEGVKHPSIQFSTYQPMVDFIQEHCDVSTGYIRVLRLQSHDRIHRLKFDDIPQSRKCVQLLILPERDDQLRSKQTMILHLNKKVQKHSSNLVCSIDTDAIKLDATRYMLHFSHNDCFTLYSLDHCLQELDSFLTFSFPCSSLVQEIKEEIKQEIKQKVKQENNPAIGSTYIVQCFELEDNITDDLTECFETCFSLHTKLELEEINQKVDSSSHLQNHVVEPIFTVSVLKQVFEPLFKFKLRNDWNTFLRVLKYAYDFKNEHNKQVDVVHIIETMLPTHLLLQIYEQTTYVQFVNQVNCFCSQLFSSNK